MSLTFPRALAAASAAAGLLVLAAAPAAAHVTVKADTTAAGAYAVLTVSVPHGCEEAPTTRVAIAIPESIPRVTPTINPNWDVEKVMTALDTPVTGGHGEQITERVSEVVYTAKTPLPDGYRDAFELSVKLPEAAGQTLYFPAVQTCTEGETAWVEIAAEGQDADELEHPAPFVTLASETAEVTPAASSEAADSEADGAPAAVSWAALALGVLGLALGGLAFARSRS